VGSVKEEAEVEKGFDEKYHRDRKRVATYRKQRYNF
jgi:hypothetical protein